MKTAKKAANPLPAHLSTEAKAIWREVIARNPHSTALLKVACEAYDRLQQARREVGKDGLTLVTPAGLQYEHPALKIEKEARSGFLQAWRILARDMKSPEKLGRPPTKRELEWTRLIGGETGKSSA